MHADVLRAINVQINSEFNAWYQYLAMAAFCEREQFTGDQSGVYPAIALTPTHSIVAWTSGAPAESTIRVLRLPAVH